MIRHELRGPISSASPDFIENISSSGLCAVNYQGDECIIIHNGRNTSPFYEKLVKNDQWKYKISWSKEDSPVIVIDIDLEHWFVNFERKKIIIRFKHYVEGLDIRPIVKEISAIFSQ